MESSRRIPPIAWVITLWLLLTVPSIFLRGAHYEEGYTVGLARGAFQDGHWLTPYIYGFRFMERPVLISWLLGGVGLLTGRLDLWVARIPAVLSILGSALLLHQFVRRYASAAAALFAAACFLVSPAILQKIVTAEPDVVVAFLLFAAATIWWTGIERGKVAVGRSLVITAILSLAGLIKGPQPLAYFFLGTGGYLAWKHQWRELLNPFWIALPSLAVCGAWYLIVYQPGDVQGWLVHSKLIVTLTPARYISEQARFCAVVALDWLPGLVLAVPAALSVWKRRHQGEHDLPGFLLIYAMACTAVLVPWPGASARYTIPGLLAIAAGAGLEFDPVRKARPRLTMLTVALAALLGLYGIAVNCVAMPLSPERFREQAIEAQRINTIVAANPHTIYVTPHPMLRDLILYLSAVRVIAFEDLTRTSPPFWTLLTSEQENALRVARHDAQITNRLELFRGALHLVEVEERAAPGAPQ